MIRSGSSVPFDVDSFAGMQTTASAYGEDTDAVLAGNDSPAGVDENAGQTGVSSPQPRPCRNNRPGVAPVHSPSENVTSPLTMIFL